jgi:hypothetical protein
MANRRLEEWELDLIKAVPGDVLRGLAEDARAHSVILSRGGTSAAKDNNEVPRPNTHGWVEAPSTSKWQADSGIAAVDRLCDAQDKIDRAARIKELAEASRHLQAMAEAEAAAKKLEEKELEEKDPQK